MPPLFDEASGRAASDGRCAPALPAALDHFHAKPWPRHRPSCGPRAGGNAPAAAGAGGPGWAWEPRRRFQRRAAGRERPSGQGGGREGKRMEGGGVRGGGSPLSVPAQPWLNRSPRIRALHPRAEQWLPPGIPLRWPPLQYPPVLPGVQEGGRAPARGRWDSVTGCPSCLLSSAVGPGWGQFWTQGWEGYTRQPS